MYIKMKWWQSAASTIIYINRNICRGINVWPCVCLSLHKVDILIINTIWLSRHEVYLPRVHVPSLLRESEKDTESKRRNTWSKKNKGGVEKWGMSEGKKEKESRIKGNRWAEWVSVAADLKHSMCLCDKEKKKNNHACHQWINRQMG